MIETSQEFVLVSGELIKRGELFWPEDASFHVLAKSWSIVDPVELANGDDNTVARRLVSSENLNIAFAARQDLIQISFAPQGGGVLDRAAFFVGHVALFSEELPFLVQTPKEQVEKQGRFVAVLRYDVTVDEATITKRASGYLDVLTQTFTPARGLLFEIPTPWRLSERTKGGRQ